LVFTLNSDMNGTFTVASKDSRKNCSGVGI
jgi:hypothetical protein